MAKQKTTLYLDEDVRRRTVATAATSGRDESEVVDALDPEDALALAYDELDSFRGERDASAA